MIEQSLQKVLGFGVEEFIKRAVEGGWIPYSQINPVPELSVARDAILLDPLSWQAVGKVEGWEDKPNAHLPFWRVQEKGNVITLGDEWENKVHTFVQTLIEASQETV